MPNTTNTLPTTSDDNGFLLQSETALSDASLLAIEYAATLGATDATAITREAGGLTMKVRGGEVETALRDGSSSMTVTVYDGLRSGRSTTQALDRSAVQRAVEKALAIAREMEPEEYTGLADTDLLAISAPDVPLFAHSGFSADDLHAAATETEQAAIEQSDMSAVRVQEAAAASHDMRWALATSGGFCRASTASMQSRWCVTIAEQAGQMVRDSWLTSERRADMMESPYDVGRKAAERSLSRLGARGLSTCRTPVLFDATIAPSLVAECCSALTGTAQYQKNTIFPDALGKAALAPHINLTEDPLEPFGMGSGAWDSEGVACKPRSIIENGTISGLFLGSFSARKLGMRSTGSADGFRNLCLTSAESMAQDDHAAMLRRLGTGLLVTEFMGGNVNPVTGDYSKAATGFWVENGEITSPVDNFTIAGNLAVILKTIAAVGADVYRSGAIRTGSILVPDLQIAGR